jgi:hypothetical protein
MTNDSFPPGWNEERVRKVLDHYEHQSGDQAVAEDEAAFADHPETVISIPVELIPVVRELIGRQQTLED